MSPVFDNPAMVDRLKAELRSWVGTGFRPNYCRKGIGADCVRFCGGVYQGLGILGDIAWPQYTVRHGGQSMLPLLLQGITATGVFHQVWQRTAPRKVEADDCCGGQGEAFILPVAQDPLNLMPGDLLVFSSGKAWHHTAIYEDGPTCWHVLETATIVHNGRTLKGGVTTANIHDPTLSDRFYVVYRPMTYVDPKPHGN